MVCQASDYTESQILYPSISADDTLEGTLQTRKEKYKDQHHDNTFHL